MKIPRDLKPGDRLWYSRSEYATVHTGPITGLVYKEDGDDNKPARIMAANTGIILSYLLSDGAEIDGDTPPIIRIERIASKPAKPKRDADVRAACSALIKCIHRECAARTEHKARKLPHHLWAEVVSLAKRLERSAP